jgi:hypothetical protein
MSLRLQDWPVLALVAAIAPISAHAADTPTPITFEAFQAGPFGTLELSGGADGYAYALTGAGNEMSKGLLGTSTSVGVQFMNGLVDLQKPDGLLRFEVQVGATNSLTLGTKPTSPSIQTWSTGPVRTASITLAPTPNFTISAGQIGSVEGFESGIDWENYNMMTTSLWYVENAQSVGVNLTYTAGPVSGTIVFGDGFDTNVWNYLQLKASYAFNDNNNLTMYGATNLGSTGLGAHFYGNAFTSYHSTTVGSAGVANLVNSSMVGGYYTFTAGNLTLVPEAQYTWSRKDVQVGLTDNSSHFGAALFANYKFGDSPFSLGGWVQYFTSNGSAFWFLNPGAQGVGMAIGPTWSPPWANKHFFVRGDVGLIHLTNVGIPGSVAYGGSGTERNQASFVVEAGVLF